MPLMIAAESDPALAAALSAAERGTVGAVLDRGCAFLNKSFVS